MGAAAEALKQITKALDEALGPLTDAWVTDVQVAYSPGTGTHVTVKSEVKD